MIRRIRRRRTIGIGGEPKVKRAAYTKQTEAAGKSNCPLCAIGQDANKARIYDLDETDVDHVSAWRNETRTDLVFRV
jgi:hypothetical protein